MKIDAIVKRVLPGTIMVFSQPIELRFSDMLAGVKGGRRHRPLRSGFGDPAREGRARRPHLGYRSRRGGCEGTGSPRLGPQCRSPSTGIGSPGMGINASDVLDVIQAVGGKTVGQVVEGQRRFAMQARFAPEYRDNVEAIRNLYIADDARSDDPDREPVRDHAPKTASTKSGGRTGSVAS